MFEWRDYYNDTRPVIGECEVCKRLIHGSDYAHYGDSYFEIDGCMVCEDCPMEYLNENCRKEG